MESNSQQWYFNCWEAIWDSYNSRVAVCNSYNGRKVIHNDLYLSGYKCSRHSHTQNTCHYIWLSVITVLLINTVSSLFTVHELLLSLRAGRHIYAIQTQESVINIIPSVLGYKYDTSKCQYIIPIVVFIGGTSKYSSSSSYIKMTHPKLL